MSLVRTLAAGMAVAAIAVLAVAAPASAHDQLVSSTPGTDERLEEAPTEITMVFSGQLLTLGDTTTGAVVLVVDESGKDWATGEVAVEGDTVTATVESGMPDAGYQVRWQVVSEDGHTIAGSIPFTIGDAEPMESTPSPSSAADSATGDDADADAGDDAAQNQTTEASDGVLRVVLIGAGGAVIALALYALYRIIRRRSAPASVDAPKGDDTENTP